MGKYIFFYRNFTVVLKHMTNTYNLQKSIFPCLHSFITITNGMHHEWRQGALIWTN